MVEGSGGVEPQGPPPDMEVKNHFQANFQLDKLPGVTKLQEPNNRQRCQKGEAMLLKAFSIRDAKAEIFNTPFFAKTHGEAERQFRTLVNDEKSVPFQYPEDFDLYFVGTYDDNTGKFESLSTPQHVLKAVQCNGERDPVPLKKDSVQPIQRQ